VQLAHRPFAGLIEQEKQRMAIAEERLMEWLRDVHAAEEQAETMLSSMARRIVHYPELKERVEQHVRETQRHEKLVRGCIERRGKDISPVKDVGAKIIAAGQAVSGLFVGDEVMKASLATYTFEAMEIASYRILVSAAEHVGDQETAQTCRQILEEEEAMADWLKKNITKLTEQYLTREETPGVTAKH
jgi:ferritin-like metal-binding protein YciE